jgi:hypothetical protein
LKQEEAGKLTAHEKHTVQMKVPMDLFGNLERVDYIKCDIEGYEIPVIPLMQPLIEQHRPLMQVETDGDNKAKLLQLFRQWQYQPYYVNKDKLLPLSNPAQALYGDIIFIPAEKAARMGATSL